MAAPKTKTREELMARRQRVAELYTSPDTPSMADVGRKLGVSAVTVYHDLCWAREQWRSRCADAIAVAKQRELARIDVLEVEAWRAWKRSIGVHVVETRKKTTVSAKQEVGLDGARAIVDVELPAEEVTRKSERLAGNPHYLEIISKCVESRRRILGLDAPIEMGGKDGGPMRFVIEGLAGASWLPQATLALKCRPATQTLECAQGSRPE